MHRTEGENHLANMFQDGPPHTRIDYTWLNAIQEEICYVIEQAGLVVQSESEDTHDQLYEAIQEMLSSQTVPRGTSMLFYADSAPLGWTLDLTMDDKLVFVTKGSGAGGQTGGSTHSTGSWTISGITDTGHTHTITSSIGDVDDTGAGGWRLDANPDTFDSATATITHDGSWRPAAYCFIVCYRN